MGEIIALQFGHYSNFIASQFWAQQKAFTKDEGYNIDVLFRGENKKEPRCLFFDFKGAYDVNLDVPQIFPEETGYSNELWGKNPELQLEDQNYLRQGLSWSDKDDTIYNKRSSNMLNKIQMDDKLNPFDNFNDGVTAFVEFEKDNESIEENLRFFAEESDQLQGFQAFTDIYNGFSGFSSAYLERILEDYPKKKILAFGTVEQYGFIRKNDLYKDINYAASIIESYKQGWQFIPLMPSKAENFKNYSSSLTLDDKVYHSSSMLASSICTILFPICKLESLSNLDTHLHTLNIRGNTNISQLHSIIDLTTDQHLLDYNSMVNLSSYKLGTGRIYGRLESALGLNDQVKARLNQRFNEVMLGSESFPFSNDYSYNYLTQDIFSDAYKFLDDSSNQTSNLACVASLQTTSDTYDLLKEKFNPLKSSKNKDLLKALFNTNHDGDELEDFYYQLENVIESYGDN